jgi:hypothetical protein
MHLNGGPFYEYKHSVCFRTYSRDLLVPFEICSDWNARIFLNKPFIDDRSVGWVIVVELVRWLHGFEILCYLKNSTLGFIKVHAPRPTPFANSVKITLENFYVICCSYGMITFGIISKQCNRRCGWLFVQIIYVYKKKRAKDWTLRNTW